MKAGCAAGGTCFAYAIAVTQPGGQELMTTIDQFLASLSEHQPDADLSPLLQALWYEKRGDWDRAHKITQKENSADAPSTELGEKVSKEEVPSLAPLGQKEWKNLHGRFGGEGRPFSEAVSPPNRFLSLSPQSSRD